MNQTPPLSPQGGATCPNCGATQNVGVAFCTNCGAALQPAKSSNPWALIGKIVVGLALFSGAIGLGALGACVLMVGGMSGGTTAINAGSGATVFFGWAAFLAVMAMVWIIFWATRKK